PPGQGERDRVRADPSRIHRRDAGGDRRVAAGVGPTRVNLRGTWRHLRREWRSGWGLLGEWVASRSTEVPAGGSKPGVAAPRRRVRETWHRATTRRIQEPRRGSPGDRRCRLAARQVEG